MQRKIIIQLQTFIDLFFGVQPFQPLPEAYFQQPDWALATRALQMPAAWRRQQRVR
jgi:hypothetical protein